MTEPSASTSTGTKDNGADLAPTSNAIRRLSSPDVAQARPYLVALLREAVADNASLGFVLPLQDAELEVYWRDVEADVAAGTRHLLAAYAGPTLVGCVQWTPCLKANQPHRADVQKLLVQRSARRQGVGATLMQAMEEDAARAGRVLLTLDTRSNSAADRCYRRWGWTSIGIIPAYALDPDLTPGPCTFFYKRLDAARAVSA